MICASAASSVIRLAQYLAGRQGEGGLRRGVMAHEWEARGGNRAAGGEEGKREEGGCAPAVLLRLQKRHQRLARGQLLRLLAPAETVRLQRTSGDKNERARGQRAATQGAKMRRAQAQGASGRACGAGCPARPEQAN